MQVLNGQGHWIDCDGDTAWLHVYRYVNAKSMNLSVRIKPEVKPDQEFFMVVGLDQDFNYPHMRRQEHWERPNLHLVFDGETGKLKSAEVV